MAESLPKKFPDEQYQQQGSTYSVYGSDPYIVGKSGSNKKVVELHPKRN